MRTKEQVTEHPLEAHARGKGLKYSVEESGRLFTTSFEIGDNGSTAIVYLKASYNEDIQHLSVFSHVGLDASPATTAAAADLCNRVNWKIPMGNFEVRPEGGAIGFRVSTFAPRGSPLPEPFATRLMASAIGSWAEYLPVFADVLRRGLPAVMAITASEAMDRN